MKKIKQNKIKIIKIKINQNRNQEITGKKEATLEGLKLFLCDWSQRVQNTSPLDAIFQIENNPLSWFYRPIIYSSLLPQPFLTINDIHQKKIINQKKITIALASFKKYLLLNDKLKEKITKKNKEKENTPPIENTPQQQEQLQNQLQTQPQNKIQNENASKVLFLTFTNHLGEDNNIFRINQIVQKIKKDQKYRPFLLVVDPISRLSIKKIYQKNNTIYSYYDPQIHQKAKDISLSLAQHWQTITPQQKEQALTNYTEINNKSGNNIEYYPQIKYHLNLLYSQEFIYLVAKWYFTYKKIILQEQIRSIVLTSQNNIFEKCLIAAAKSQNIPVFIIQHGIGLGTLPTIDTPDNVKFAIFGKKYITELTNLGVNKKNINITGPIIFDEIAKYTDPISNYTNNSNNNSINNEKSNQPLEPYESKTILLATSPFIEDRFLTKDQYFERVTSILTQLKTITKKINLKLHPRERNLEEYQKIIQQLQLTSIISCDTDRHTHYQLIRNCNLVITFGSTVALEAMIMGKPTLTIDLFDKHNPTNGLIINSGATTIVKYNQPLAPLIQNLLIQDPKQQQANAFIKELCYKIDGKASERIVRYIYKEIETIDKKNKQLNDKKLK